jgi:hypothetical protein
MLSGKGNPGMDDLAAIFDVICKRLGADIHPGEVSIVA